MGCDQVAHTSQTYSEAHRGTVRGGTRPLAMTFVRLPESARRHVEERVRTVPAQRPLVVCLPVPEPMESVLNGIRTLVVIVLPPGMQERLDPMESGP